MIFFANDPVIVNACHMDLILFQAIMRDELCNQISKHLPKRKFSALCLRLRCVVTHVDEKETEAFSYRSSNLFDAGRRRHLIKHFFHSEFIITLQYHFHLNRYHCTRVKHYLKKDNIKIILLSVKFENLIPD